MNEVIYRGSIEAMEKMQYIGKWLDIIPVLLVIQVLLLIIAIAMLVAILRKGSGRNQNR